MSSEPAERAANVPRIFCFSNVAGGGEGVALALAEDGCVLGSHFCSHEHFVRHDLGVTPSARPDRHETYRRHYPEGYEMEFVPAAEVDRHSGIAAAYALNQEHGEDWTCPRWPVEPNAERGADE